MSHNPIKQLTQQLINYFTIPKDVPSNAWQHYGELVRINKDNVDKIGDFSISAVTKNWQYFCQRSGLELRYTSQEQMLPDEQSIKELLEHSHKFWLYPLKKVKLLHKERIALYFQREAIVVNVIQMILRQGDAYGKCSMIDEGANKLKERRTLCLQLHEELLQADCGTTKELHQFRAKQLYQIVRRLLDYTDWLLVDPKDQTADTLLVCVESSNQSSRVGDEQKPSQAVSLSCGPVLEPTTKIATTLTSDEYNALRANDMLLTAMHRSGMRNVGDHKALIQQLGRAAVIVDLFEVRHNSAVSLVRNGQSRSKGASFILYNSARMGTLMRLYDANKDANKSTAEPLPPMDAMLTNLTQDIEWELIFGYLLSFPDVVESTLAQLRKGQCGVHLLVRYIINLVSTFSRFYRKYKVLWGTFTARIYLVKAVHQVLKSALALLGIEPVNAM
ncbi:LOW QUALITY PROTEIN: uncharacterized protein LOC133849438 [Drosophila sulfurigaster albostrigata]|uniref:LOW QUALITY PROTEIN: uncharacterized protein LOC133849438 n=1 Tax=Drosophila sulfurigaster albostrigata TaxID=89887 RepID=UPI002D21E0BA|nr:LOW QUALITY PROTEIN: uncharacterized protein LOC133849438 [Drosophila sulfurigaster albostrigata]